MNKIKYKNYKMMSVDSDGTVWMSDDPPCSWWLVIRCDSEHDRKVFGSARKRDWTKEKLTIPFHHETYKSSKKTYHSIIEELWV